MGSITWGGICGKKGGIEREKIDTVYKSGSKRKNRMEEERKGKERKMKVRALVYRIPPRSYRHYFRCSFSYFLMRLHTALVL